MIIAGLAASRPLQVELEKKRRERERKREKERGIAAEERVERCRNFVWLRFFD